MKEKGRWMDGSIDGETHRENLIDREMDGWIDRWGDTQRETNR